MSSITPSGNIDNSSFKKVRSPQPKYSQGFTCFEYPLVVLKDKRKASDESEIKEDKFISIHVQSQDEISKTNTAKPMSLSR